MSTHGSIEAVNICANSFDRVISALECSAPDWTSPRKSEELNESSITVSRHRTAQVMRANCLKARQKTRCKRATNK